MKHPIVEKVKIPAISIAVSYLIFYLTNHGTLSIGKIINKFYTCQDAPGASFHCYGIYDVYLMLLMAGIVIVSLLIITVRVVLLMRANKKNYK